MSDSSHRFPGAAAPRTAVIAGSGDLGTEVGLRFADRGLQVVGIRRQADLLPGSFDRQSLDLSVDAPVIPADTAVVVVALAAGSRDPDVYRATYLDGLRHVLDAVAASGASPRIVFVSSTAVYDVADGSVVDEDTPATASGPTAAILLEAEQLLASRSAASGWKSVSLRLGGIYGPGRERLIDQVRQGAHAPRNSPHTNRIHRDDAAAAIVHLALDVATPPPVVLGVDDESAPLSDVLRFIAAELDVDEPSEGSEMARGAAGDKRCDNALLHSTGFEFAYPTYREGYRAVLAGDGVRHP